MVSLNNSRYQGGVFFVDQEEASLISVYPKHHSRRGFVPLRTAGITVVQLVCLAALEVLMFQGPPRTHVQVFDRDRPFNLLVLLHVGLWVLIALGARYKQHRHRISRLYGYLAFYRETTLLRKTSFLVLSAGNAGLLGLATLWQHESQFGSLHRMTVLQILFTVELAVCIPCEVTYLVKVLAFDREQHLADVHSDMFTGQASASNLDYDEDTPLTDVLEKQSDIIRYMKQHAVNLSKRIEVLSLQLQQYESGGAA